MTAPLGSRETTARLGSAQEREWVRGIREGDTAAFEAMVRAYADPLFGYAYGYVRARDVAEELVQDLFLRIWSGRETWEVPGSLASYLFQAIRNRAVSHIRHARVERRFRERALLGADPSTLLPRPVPTDESVRVDELAGAIDQAVAALPQRCREVFTLSREQQLTYAEIADVLGISVKTVEIHMGRALAMLRGALASWKR